MAAFQPRGRRESVARVSLNRVIVDVVQKACAMHDRDKVIGAFMDFPEHFSCIPLSDSEVTLTQAINDIHREKVILNDVQFLGHGELFIKSLEQVVRILTASPDYTGSTNVSSIVEAILCKASRTTSGSDSYFTIEQLFGADTEYLLKGRGRGDGASSPINIEVFLVDGSLHSVVRCVNFYSLVHLGDLDSASESFSMRSPEDWLRLDTIVVEKTDFRTGRNIRYLRVTTPDVVKAQLPPKITRSATDGVRSLSPLRRRSQETNTGGSAYGPGSAALLAGMTLG